MSPIHRTPTPRDPSIRLWPYPFRAGLALSSDIEFTTLEWLEDLMPFLNGRGPTPLGQGLGLEVTASMFFYSAGGGTVAFFEGAETDSPLSDASSRLMEYLRAGWIDCNHSYGDFDGHGGFCRRHAERACEVLEEAGVALPVYTNHGSSDNVQNLGDGHDYQRGDRREDGAYHADLLHRSGARWLWTDSAVDQGPDDKPGLRRRLRRWSGLERVPPGLIHPWMLADGQRVRRFWRFRGTGKNAPNLSSLGRQLEIIDWDSLYTNQGGLVLYQHLGVLDRIEGRCLPASRDAVRCDAERFLAPFRRLQAEHEEERLWIAGTGRFLQYLEMLESVRILKSRDTGGGALRVQVITPGAAGPRAVAGLTIHVDGCDEVTLQVDGEPVEVTCHPPDETGRPSVSVPWEPLPWIW